jgi:WhiB family transcriptional regulator, redox-sensing transcriptional regulator
VVTAPGVVPHAGTRRARILAHLKQHPDLTAYELAKALGVTSSLHGLLRAMERKAQVIATTEWRRQQGRRVSVWRIAPPGTLPPPAAVSAEVIGHRRRRRRLSQRRRRARANLLPRAEVPVIFVRRAVSVLPPGAACLGTDPELFFPPEGEDGAEARAKAKAICASCPIRSECYGLAFANSEEAGIWGGEDFGAQPRPERQAEVG